MTFLNLSNQFEAAKHKAAFLKMSDAQRVQYVNQLIDGYFAQAQYIRDMAYEMAGKSRDEMLTFAPLDPGHFNEGET